MIWKEIEILTSPTLQKYEDETGIRKLTGIIDVFHALEVQVAIISRVKSWDSTHFQKSKVMEQHVIEYLDKTEPTVLRDLYISD